MTPRGLSLAAGAWFFLLSRTIEAAPSAPATGASVDETHVTKILYVDPAHTEAADDEKHGAADTPFATLGFACREATRAKDARIGVKIILAAGTYREAAEIPAPRGQPDTEAPLVIEAAERDQAIVDGADTEGWSPSTWKIENGRWTHPWPFTRGRKAAHKPPGPADTAAYRPGDLVLVNGTPLRQVDTEAALAPGSFWVNVPRIVPAAHREHAAAGAGASVVVQPPEETPLEGAIVQVGVRASGLKISGRRNVVVRGLMIQHAASPVGANGAAGVCLSACSNVLVEDVLSQWNDGTGFLVDGGTGVTLRRVRVLHNGAEGLASSQTENLLVEDGEASFNYFRPEWAGWVDPQGVAAVSAFGTRGGTWRRLRAIGNTGRGVLLRGGTTLRVEDSVIQGNVVCGVGVQACAGPVVVRRCVVAGTKAAPEGSGKDTGGTGGMVLTDSANVSLESNVVANNAATQLAWWEPTRGTLPFCAERHRYQHNVLVGLDPGQFVCELPGNDGSPRLNPTFFPGLETDNNCFWNPASAEGFAFSGRPGTPPAPVDLPKWREALVGRMGSGPAGAPLGLPEAHSLWEDPLFVSPAEGDYRLKKESPVADWDLPSEDVATGQ